MTEKEQSNLHESLFPAAWMGAVDGAHILGRQSAFAKPEAAHRRRGNSICSHRYEDSRGKKTILTIRE